MMGLDHFSPGGVWMDTEARPIQAHGGGILYDQGTYYWFGENKGGETKEGVVEGLYRVDVIGVSCYSSKDLLNWKYEGLALPAEADDPQSDLHPSRVVERPKVIYNERTRKYVMWMHIDTADYQYARAGAAVSDSPTGPYRYLGSIRPNDTESRDMTVFRDDDGRAYLFHSSDWNRTMHIAPLTDDYLELTGVFERAFVGRSREAPAVFKHKGKYFVITSGCTGWDPNEAEYAMASSIMGPWKVMGNPCHGLLAERTFDAQSAFVLPVAGKPGAFIFVADRWDRDDLGNSRYVWLPVKIQGEVVSIDWMDRWDLSAFEG
jgi:hypothetical protein